jgi:hypothetical protein
MSLVIDAVVVAGGVAIGRWIGRRFRARRSAAEGTTAASQSPSEPARPAQVSLEAFPCKLGDVVVRTAERDEAWLAGALVFLEGGPVAALFVAPEAGGDHAVLVGEANSAVIAWLTPIAEGDLALTTDDPPLTIEHAGARFERVRRRPVAVVRVGSGATSVGDRATLAEYIGPDAERLVVVAGTDRRLAWRGVDLAQADYDVLPGGKGTLET